jgi:hypothetical protein
MNTKAKGSRNEHRSIEVLEAAGNPCTRRPCAPALANNPRTAEIVKQLAAEMRGLRNRSMTNRSSEMVRLGKRQLLAGGACCGSRQDREH